MVGYDPLRDCTQNSSTNYLNYYRPVQRHPLALLPSSQNQNLAFSSSSSATTKNTYPSFHSSTDHPSYQPVSSSSLLGAVLLTWPYRPNLDNSFSPAFVGNQNKNHTNWQCVWSHRMHGLHNTTSGSTELTWPHLSSQQLELPGLPLPDSQTILNGAYVDYICYIYSTLPGRAPLTVSSQLSRPDSPPLPSLDPSLDAHSHSPPLPSPSPPALSLPLPFSCSPHLPPPLSPPLPPVEPDRHSPRLPPSSFASCSFNSSSLTNTPHIEPILNSI